MRILAAHQTYFFPYIGYYSVLNRADKFVHMDCLQFEKQSWMTRNRIIGEDGNVRYISVPVRKNKRETPIKDMMINYDTRWEDVVLNQLGYYRKRAPYYKEVRELLETIFSQKYENLAELNIHSTDLVLERLGIKKDIYRQSELTIAAEDVHEADEWGLTVCKSFEGIDTYINAPMGKEFYDQAKYNDAGYGIEFMQNRLRPYEQKNDEFIPGLSIIDVMMFNSSEEIKEMLDDYYLV